MGSNQVPLLATETPVKASITRVWTNINHGQPELFLAEK